MDGGVFNEEYIGRLPELEEISKGFSSILKEFRKAPKSCNPNKLPENKSIQKTIKKFFGFKAVHIYWIPYNISNAYTIFDTGLLADEHAKGVLQRIPGKGFYDTDHAMVFCIFIYTGLLLRVHDLTGDEMTAVVLHEIGHNCDDLPFVRLNIFKRLYLTLSKKTSTEYNNEQKIDVYNTTKKKWDDVYKDKGRREKIDEYAEKIIFGQVNQNALVLAFTNVFLAITNCMYIPTFPILQLITLSARKMEQFADSMPTSYGYGKELNSALRKMGEYGDIVKNKTPTKSILQDLFTTQIEILMILIDEHSSSQARCKDCIIKLKNDLRTSNYPPELKDTLLDEIRKCEDEYVLLVNTDPEKRISIIRGFRQICDKLFGGRPELSRLFGQHQM